MFYITNFEPVILFHGLHEVFFADVGSGDSADDFLRRMRLRFSADVSVAGAVFATIAVSIAVYFFFLLRHMTSYSEKIRFVIPEKVSTVIISRKYNDNSQLFGIQQVTPTIM